MLSETLFDNFVHTFLLKPLLIAGKAMQYYGLRAGDDYDFLIPPEDFRSLRLSVPDGLFTNTCGDTGIRVGNYEFYVSHFGCSYFQLETKSVNERDYRVVHLEILLFLKTLTLIHKPENQKAREDMLLLMGKLGVLPLVSEQPFEVVNEITITQLPPDIGILLAHHGCNIFERGHENIQITFPANTQRQMLLPPTVIERSRIVLSDGLELRHEIDRTQEMSLLSVVH